MNAMTCIHNVNKNIIDHGDENVAPITYDLNKGYDVYVKQSRKRIPDVDVSKPRSNSTKFSTESVAYLHEWLVEHIHKPYPDRQEMEYLAMGSGLTPEQVNNWFTNTRKRKLKINATTKTVAQSFQYKNDGAEGANCDHVQIDPMNRFTRFPPATFALVTPCITKPTKPSLQFQCIPQVTPNGMTSIERDFKADAKYKPFHFSADDHIETEFVEGDIESLFDHTNVGWSRRLRAYLATEEQIVMELGARPIYKASMDENPHDSGTNPASKKLMHHCSAYIKQGQAKHQPACDVVNISEEIQFGVESTDQQFLDGFKLNLGILDDLEGGADEFGVMALFHSQNM